MGDSFDCKYDGILGSDFWENKMAAISYCERKIVTDKVVINFDDKTNRVGNEPHKLTLKARTESIVELPASSK